MKQRRLLFAIFSVFLFLGAAAAGTGAHADPPQPSRRMIVRLKHGADWLRFFRKHGLSVVDSDLANDTFLVQISGPYERTASSLTQDPFAFFVELNVDLGLDLNAQWTTAFDSAGAPRPYEGQPLVPQVNAVDAARLTGGAGVTVAVLDTGISTRPARLAGKVLPGWNFIDNNADTDDVPAMVDGRPTGPDHAVGHGTAVAGMVAVIAPETKLLPVKVLNAEGQGTLWGLVRGIQFAVARGARVVNISLSTPVRSKLLDQVLRDARAAGALVVAAAGNENSSEPRYPAASPHVLGVAALTSDNIKAAFSNFGPSVDVSAPGVDVITTFWDGTFVMWSGTSFAAPIVSGQAALLYSIGPRFDGGDVAKLIEKTSISLDTLNPDYAGQLGSGGGGLVDVDASIAAALTILQRGPNQ